MDSGESCGLRQSSIIQILDSVWSIHRPLPITHDETHDDFATSRPAANKNQMAFHFRSAMSTSGEVVVCHSRTLINVLGSLLRGNDG